MYITYAWFILQKNQIDNIIAFIQNKRLCYHCIGDAIHQSIVLLL